MPAKVVKKNELSKKNTKVYFISNKYFRKNKFAALKKILYLCRRFAKNYNEITP